MQTTRLLASTLGSLVFLLVVLGEATAATPGFTRLGVDQLAVEFFTSLTSVWIPIIALTALIALVVNMFFGFFQIGAKVVGFVFGAALLAGGLPMVNNLVGGNITTAFAW